jgi:hypothetical protein
MASLRATATLAFFGPMRLTSLAAQLLSGEGRRTTVRSTLAASKSARLGNLYEGISCARSSGRSLISPITPETLGDLCERVLLLKAGNGLIAFAWSTGAASLWTAEVFSFLFCPGT